MGRFLPTGSDATISRSDDATVVFLDDDRVDAVVEAVGSDTAREILRRLLAEPLTASELATELDMTVETVSYHLEALEERELISECDTVYSEKGREMTVYAIATDPTVVIFGSSDDEAQLRAAVSQLASALGPVAVLIALKQSLSDVFEVLDWV